MKEYDVIIVGGGASGLYLAASLGGRYKTAVIESGARVGRKLSATGGGQGNLSNADISAERYFGDRRVIASVLGDSPHAVLGMFDGLLTTDARGRMYPAGRQASALTDCLRKKAAMNADIMTDTRVTDIRRGFIMETSAGAMKAKRVALCTGGKAGRNFGTDGSSYALATGLGHTVTPLYPSLVQLKTDDRRIRTLRGVRVDCKVMAHCGGEMAAENAGEVIFGDGVVGGSAIYYISPFIAGKKNCELTLSFLPEFTEEQIARDVRRKMREGAERTELLALTLNNVLGRAIIRSVGGGAEEIAHAVKNFTLKICGDAGFENAQVTRGGVPLSEVTDGLESRFVKGLHFAGEVLDVDGECGGYNLHWAWASARRVAESIAEDLR